LVEQIKSRLLNFKDELEEKEFTMINAEGLNINIDLAMPLNT
jgi:hypothetical protein